MRIAPDIPRPRTTAGLALFAWAETSATPPRTVAAPVPQNPCTLPAAPPPEALRIRAILATRIGRRQAITAPQIAQAAGLWPDLRDADRGTKVREVIATWLVDMIIDGCVLVAASSGYWLTADPSDASHYSASLHSRIREISLRERRFRRAARTAGFAYHGHGHWSRP